MAGKWVYCLFWNWRMHRILGLGSLSTHLTQKSSSLFCGSMEELEVFWKYGIGIPFKNSLFLLLVTLSWKTESKLKSVMLWRDTTWVCQIQLHLRSWLHEARPGGISVQTRWYYTRPLFNIDTGFPSLSGRLALAHRCFRTHPLPCQPLLTTFSLLTS